MPAATCGNDDTRPRHARRAIYLVGGDVQRSGGWHASCCIPTQTVTKQGVQTMETLTLVSAIGGGMGAVMVLTRLGMTAMFALLPGRRP